MAKHRMLTVGGTFSPLHKGHKALLDAAFSEGEGVFIGLTSDAMVEKKKLPEPIPAYGERKKSLLGYLEGKGWGNRTHIFRIEDEYGFGADFENLGAIICTEFTHANAEKINARRIARGMDPLDIIQAEIVLAHDGKPISSSRIRGGEIDSDGNLL
jgi:pantetheine-phosphate adenylyltransferase